MLFWLYTYYDTVQYTCTPHKVCIVGLRNITFIDLIEKAIGRSSQSETDAD